MNRIESEKRTVGMMVRLYCRRHEGWVAADKPVENVSIKVLYLC